VTDLVHFYHCWVDGDWEEPVQEHLAALEAARIPFRTRYVVLVGHEDRRMNAWEWYFKRGWRRHDADSGHQEVTINLIRRFAIEYRGVNVFYAHDKAAWHRGPDDIHVAWRRNLTEYTIARWRECVNALGTHDIAGPYWLTRENFPNNPDVDTPFFGGNYWWARSDYLRTLPVCTSEKHTDAERWIGLGTPTVFSQDPRWPGFPPPLPS
jgi:hypothetical protein